MTNEELFQARTNPDFLKYLEEARLNSIKSKNIALMYETLDSMLVLDLDEDKVNELYQTILKTAFDNVEKIIEKKVKLSLEEDNFFYTRALYEHAIEKWTNENLKGAKDLFFVISNITDDEILQKSLNVLLIFLSKDTDFDTFYDKYVFSDSTIEDEKYGYFITSFNFDKDDFLKQNSEILEQEYKNLQYLIMEKK
ncbi:hypothetical protein [Aliarcobacter vitoriensis]|uniref:Uncharacterized protein n=1 Tax=Aliarcobacter vitoriensis TaxID=2011099 RepID=A0A366MXS1_9BACT|nr:hypothetical protein [Aliarcobacter vitoriensis]RBQ30212.1 hypothetical protein CRU91_00790 [Aliarcobacter vitoriensis]